MAQEEEEEEEEEWSRGICLGWPPLRYFQWVEVVVVVVVIARIKILCALDESEMCVCDIASLLNMTHSAISHQLRILKSAKLVKNRREGKVVFYSLDDHHVKDIFEQGLEHINE